jgi:hypothetical protein
MNSFATEPARRWRNNTVHREVDHRRARWVWKAALAVTIALTPFAVYLLQTMSFVQSSYAIEELRLREVRLFEAERKLRVEKATLESLPAVEARAASELRLEHAPASRVIVLPPGELPRSVQSVAPARGVPSR